MALPNPLQPAGASETPRSEPAAANTPRPIPIKSPSAPRPTAGTSPSAEPPDEFDPYYRWLGIPRAEQPPTLYRLLGLSQLEPDLGVIEEAANRQMAHVRAHQNGPYSAESQRLLNELSTAKLTLLHVGKKLAYDRTLRPPAPPPLPSAGGMPAVTPSLPPRPVPISPIPVAAAPQPVAVSAGQPPSEASRPAPQPVPQGAAPSGRWANSGATAISAPPRPIPVPVPVPRQSDPAKLVLRETPRNPDDELKRIALKKAPPWAISCVVHMLLLIILGLWYIAGNPIQNGIFLDVASTEIGQQLLDDSIALSSEDSKVETSIVPPSELAKVDDPFSEAKPEPLDFALEGVRPIMNLDGPTINIALMGREPGTKEALLGKYGGNGESEDAVQRGLAWLATYQRKDGSWSLKGPYKSGALDARDLPESATAMALLAFQGAGNTHQRGEYKKQVAKGIYALLRMQGGNGDFFQEGGRSNNWFYAHAQCTIAVCELYGMTKDEELRRPAEQAIKFLIESQDPELGGWRYLPRSDSDTSVTGWVVMAFQSARMAGLEVPSPVLAKISEYLDKVTEDGSTYGYQVGTEPSPTMTAEALLCRQYLGWRRDDPRLVAGAERLLKHLPRYEDRDVYYWYYGTQMMHHMEGKFWPEWNAALRNMLVKRQERTGPEKGSWDPQGEHPDRWAALGQGGRLYTTCLSLYMLEVYYRHLPIYGVQK